MDARNNHVQRRLLESYGKKLPNGRLKIFCVSNKVYNTYTKKGDDVWVEASGIPRLRQFCYSIPAEARLAEAEHFLQSKVSNLLNRMQLWLVSTEAPVADDIARDESLPL